MKKLLLLILGSIAAAAHSADVVAFYSLILQLNL